MIALHGAPRGRRGLDPRAKLLLLVAACFAGQYLPPALLPAWLLLLMLLFLFREMRSIRIRVMLRAGISFTLVWTALTAGSAALDGTPWMEALAGALPLAGRLFAFTLAGMAFVAFSSPVETGKAVAWLLGPILGRRAWIPALCVALCAWFLPTILGVAGQVRAGIRARGLRVGVGARTMLVAGTALRILEATAADLAVGIASRGLDNPESWQLEETKGISAQTSPGRDGFGRKNSPCREGISENDDNKGVP